MTAVVQMWGMSVPEAAEALGVSTQTVRRMFNRPVGHRSGWLTGQWAFNPDLGFDERRVDPEAVDAERRRRAGLAAAATQPPTDTKPTPCYDSGMNCVGGVT